MATPTLSKHTLPGALGEILVDVRAGGRESPRPAVVVVPGFKGFKDWGMFPPFAERLALAGFTAVTFNPSGSGVDDRGEFTRPERFGHNTIGAELSDLLSVLDALHAGRLGAPRPAATGLVGHSRGGGVALLAAVRDLRVRALVTWAAIGSIDRWTAEVKRDWRERGRLDVVNTRTGQVLPLFTDPLDELERHAAGRFSLTGAAAKVTVPWLIVHGEADESVTPEDARRLHSASGHATTELLVIPGAGHTFGAVHPWRGTTPELDRVTQATVNWMARFLN